MSRFSPLKNPVRSLENALHWLKDRGYEVVESDGARYRVQHNQCVATVEAGKDGSTRLVADLVDRGYQKFFKTEKLEVPATAERLTELHNFAEELKEAFGYTSLYNEGLGSVSGSYQYDRVKGRA
jgi:hypothetical protein